MKYSVPTNWNEDLMPLFYSPQIYEVYGKLAEDFVGGGRSALSMSYVSKNKAARYIKEVRACGKGFNYLLNASCLGGREFTPGGRREIFKLLDWLAKINVDSVTVTVPYLAELIKKNYPSLKVEVSLFAHVDSIEKARFWEAMGVDSINLSNKINRNFGLLKKIKSLLKCRLKLIANNDCLYDCPYALYHENFASHSSQNNYHLGDFCIDYCWLNCRLRKLSDPVLFIITPWIRPEDACHYEGIVDYVKLSDRRLPSLGLKKIITAYLDGCYEGNLLDLFPHSIAYTPTSISNLLLRIKYFKPFTVSRVKNLIRLQYLLKKMEVHIDNNSLDGFIDHFKNHSCAMVSCSECGYCKEIAGKVLRINKEYQERICREYQDFLESSLFKRS